MRCILKGGEQTERTAMEKDTLVPSFLPFLRLPFSTSDLAAPGEARSQGSPRAHSAFPRETGGWCWLLRRDGFLLALRLLFPAFTTLTAPL